MGKPFNCRARRDARPPIAGGGRAGDYVFRGMESPISNAFANRSRGRHKAMEPALWPESRARSPSPQTGQLPYTENQTLGEHGWLVNLNRAVRKIGDSPSPTARSAGESEE